jgi:predicted methyltransferase
MGVDADGAMLGPLLTLDVLERMRRAAAAGEAACACSLDLGRSQSQVAIGGVDFGWQGQRFPFPASCRDRTIYYWDGGSFQAAARYTSALVKLVPTEWGPPTFEIDGIKMLPTARVSPYADAERKVNAVEPRGKSVLDTCGGLGYFAAWCLHGQARRVLSLEKSADVLWLRSLNPWSPAADERLELVHGDILEQIAALPDRSVDAVLHDPPRFGIAGELYSARFYAQLARVTARGGRLYHYTGAPNKLSRGRDLPREVAARLRRAGFSTQADPDGVIAVMR